MERFKGKPPTALAVGATLALAAAMVVVLTPATAWAWNPFEAAAKTAATKVWGYFLGLLWDPKHPWLIGSAVLTLVWMLGLPKVRPWTGRLGGPIAIVGFVLANGVAIAMTLLTAAIWAIPGWWKLVAVVGVLLWAYETLKSLPTLLKGWVREGLGKGKSYVQAGVKKKDPGWIMVVFGGAFAAGTIAHYTAPAPKGWEWLAFWPGYVSGLGGLWFLWTVYRKVAAGEDLEAVLGLGKGGHGGGHGPTWYWTGTDAKLLPPGVHAHEGWEKLTPEQVVAMGLKAPGATDSGGHPPKAPGPTPPPPAGPGVVPPATGTPCPHGCGATPPPGAKFCPGCRKALPGAAAPAAAPKAVTPMPPAGQEDDENPYV